MPPLSPRPSKTIPPLIVTGPGRPAPLKKQPLPAYGPYKLPLTDAERRVVIRKRTPKYIDTPRGLMATGGGGVGFFTKGDKAPIMARVRNRALARDDMLRSARLATPPPITPLRDAIKEVKKKESSPDFLEGLANDVGLTDFYVDNVIPVVGRAFGQYFENAKQTYGASLLVDSPALAIGRTVADAVGQEDKIDKPFDYAANLVKAAVGIAKTQGFEPAKPYITPALDFIRAPSKKETEIKSSILEPLKQADDYLLTEVPVLGAVREWSSKNAVQPTKDAATEILSRITGQPINKRIDKADEVDRNFVFLSNDITQRGAEAQSSAPQDRRDRWIQMATGQYDDPAWVGYKTPFTVEQLQRMSDYELANAAYGTHTSAIASFFEAAKSDIKKIGSMPAVLGMFANQIDDAQTNGDFRGLGNMAEFLVRQGVANMMALNKAGIWVSTAGQQGNYNDLVRALQAEPILTSLDVLATASGYGKAATTVLKTGGALTKAGAIASRIPGAARAGSGLARFSERVAAKVPVRAAGEVPDRAPRVVERADLTPEQQKAWLDDHTKWVEESQAEYERRLKEINESPEQAAAMKQFEEDVANGMSQLEAIAKTPRAKFTAKYGREEGGKFPTRPEPQLADHLPDDVVMWKDLTPEQQQAFNDDTINWIAEAEREYIKQENIVRNSPEQAAAEARINQANIDGLPVEGIPNPLLEFKRRIRETQGPDGPWQRIPTRPKPDFADFADKAVVPDEVVVGTKSAVPIAGPIFRTAASAGRGLRKIADTDVIEVRDPGIASLGEVTGATIGPDRRFRTSESFFSKSSGLLRKRLYEGTNPLSRFFFGRGVVSDANTVRAVESAVIEQMGDKRAAPVMNMFKQIFKESPDLALRVMWDLSGSQALVKPSGLGGEVVRLTPGGRADELEMVLDGKLWVRKGEAGPSGSDDAFRFSDTNPASETPGAQWQQVVVKDPKKPILGEMKKPLVLKPTEIANIKTNIELLRKLDAFPEEVVARARERLEAPYRAQFGESIGKRFNAANSPEGSGIDLLQLSELQNMRSNEKLGVKVDPRVADISPKLQSRLSSSLGIAKPTGLNRRALAGVARLQDETIARLLPLVGDEFRAEVEKILGEETVKAAATVEIYKAEYEQLNKLADELTAKAEETLNKLKDQIAQIEERLGALNAEEHALKEAEPAVANRLADSAVSFWKKVFDKITNNETPNGPAYIAFADNETLANAFKEPLIAEDYIVFGEKTGDATGSNILGDSGFWTGEDGVKRYVKDYATGLQAENEAIANKIYRILGIAVPESKVAFVNSKALVANDIVESTVFKWNGPENAPEESVSFAKQILNGAVADLWLANWDTIGQGGENILLDVNDLTPVRIDQGGALFYRAQGTPKTPEDIANFDIEDLVTKNSNYKKVLNQAGYEHVRDIPFLQAQLEAIDSVVTAAGGMKGFVDKLFGDDLWWTNEKKFAYEELLTTRLDELKKQIGLSEEHKNKSLSPTDQEAAYLQTAKEAKGTLSSYVLSGYKQINEALRETAYALIPDSNPVKKKIDHMDFLIDQSPRTSEAMILYRGNGSGRYWNALEPGSVISDEGFTSASFEYGVAANMFFGDVNQNPKGAVVEIYVPEGTKGIYPNAVTREGQPQASGIKEYLSDASFGSGEQEFILPRGTQFYVMDVDEYQNGARIARVYAITPDSEFFYGGTPDNLSSLPKFGGKQQSEILDLSRNRANSKVTKVTEEDLASARQVGESAAQAAVRLEGAVKDHQVLVDALGNVDMIAESLMRDWIESSDVPTGARVFIPILGNPKGAKKTVFPADALGSRGRNRDLLKVYTGQYAMLGTEDDLRRFSGALARNLRIPFVAFESVTRFTDYLMRTGATIKFDDDAKVFERQKEELLASSFLNNNGELNSDYVILPVNEETGFLNKRALSSLNADRPKEIGTFGRSDAGVDDSVIAGILAKALEDNAIRNLDDPRLKGSRVVIINRKRFDALQKEMEAASKAPGILRRITRQWVRFTLTTLPRTPIANVVGSGFLSALGGGLAGYPEAMRMIRRGDAPPELLSNGLAGSFNEGGDLVIPVEGGKFKGAQNYMNYMYYYNVMGEDLARLAVFAQQAKNGIKGKAARARIDAELADAMDLNDSFQTLLEAVARGEFANGKTLTPELIKIRDIALQKADDFLGGSRGLTSGQRTITSFVPFWMWYKHIFKMYFYTLPFKYPVRALTMNAMARLGAQESAQNGFYDSFYEDAVKFGEEVFGSNTYATGLTSNIYPFNFGGALEFEEGAPGTQFALSSLAPTITLPARLAGIGIPGAPIIGASGERLKPGDVFAPGYAEAAVAETEKLFAPLGLLQSAIAPRSSVAFDAYRLATGQPLPEAQPRGEGSQYAVTPRGYAGLGLPQSVLELAARSFGLGVARVPISGPVYDRRIRSQESLLQDEARKRYRESLGLDY